MTQPIALKAVNTAWRIPAIPATTGVKVRTTPMNGVMVRIFEPYLAKKSWDSARYRRL
jgi:hypothetical protein